MPNGHTLEDLLDFLSHAGERGLMPVATAQALAVGTRNVFAVLDDAERTELPFDDLDGVIKRFNNKRAREFNPASLKEYGRRARKAVEMYLQWKNDPANFSVKTRSTNGPKKKAKTSGRPSSASQTSVQTEYVESPVASALPPNATGAGNGYQTNFPVRPGHVVTLVNIPMDMTNAEAERLAQFIRILGPA